MIDSQGVANSAVTEPTTALLDEDVEVEGDSDSDEDDLPISSQAKDSAERRRAQNAAFNSWVAQKAEQVTETEVKEALKTTNDEVLSVRNMLAKQETSVISSPREYQMELFERAKEDNVIAVLDTGSGKTLIAVLLLRHILEKEVEDRAAGLPPRISFFLVGCPATYNACS